MPPTGCEPFLAAVRARPWDDAPRLVYADWLEEHGDPRGEFIRLQCQLAALEPNEPTFARLVDREAALLGEFGERWCLELPAWARAGCEFRRGFIERVPIWSAERFQSLDELRQATPVQTLALHDVAGKMPLFVATGVLDWLTGIELLDSQAGFQEFLELLRVRDLDDDGIPDAVTLRRLSLLGLKLPDAAGIVLKTKIHMPELQALELVRCTFTPLAAQFLADSTRVPGLTHLDLSENEIGDAGVGFLCHSEQRMGLQSLALRDVGLTNAGIDHLVAATFASNLKKLDLSGNRLTDPAAFTLAAGLPNLQCLSARNCFFTARGLLHLQERFGARMHV